MTPTASIQTHTDERVIIAPPTIGGLVEAIQGLIDAGQSPDSAWEVHHDTVPAAQARMGIYRPREFEARWRIFTCNVEGCEVDGTHYADAEEHAVCWDHGAADLAADAERRLDELAKIYPMTRVEDGDSSALGPDPLTAADELATTYPLTRSAPATIDDAAMEAALEDHDAVVGRDPATRGPVTVGEIRKIEEDAAAESAARDAADAEPAFPPDVDVDDAVAGSPMTIGQRARQIEEDQARSDAARDRERESERDRGRAWLGGFRPENAMGGGSPRRA